MNYTTSSESQEDCRVLNHHYASGNEWYSDIPRALGGLEEMPRPSEYLAATAASCMLSLMSLMLLRKNENPKGMKVEAACVEQDAAIRELNFRLIIPERLKGQRALLMEAAANCPVKKALSPQLAILCEWVWL